MGCLGRRKKEPAHFVDQKWDYIHLDDFKSKGCGTGFAYGFLWCSLLLSVSVYIVDTFTAVQLLAFNRWSSQIEPAIGFSVSKWIFSICIILSFANLAFEGIRAYRVVRRGNIAECYLDSMAVRWESIRLGSGQGWKRFLVFTELTKSKKGAHYIALFTYFNFQAWIRVIFCAGPRQVVNALTLRSVYMAQLAVNSQTVEGSISSFFQKLELLAEQDPRQAAILSGMLFTLVVWVFSVLYLLMAVCFYVLFLFHWIPKSDGGLTGYCERKVNKALLRIVTKHVNRALAKGHADRMKAALNGEKLADCLESAVPTLPNVSLASLEKSATLPPAYTTRPPTPGNGGGGSGGGGHGGHGLHGYSNAWQQPFHTRFATLEAQPSYSSQNPFAFNATTGFGAAGAGSDSVDQYLPKPPPTKPHTMGIRIPKRFPIRSNTMEHHIPRAPPARSRTMDHHVPNPPAPTRPDAADQPAPEPLLTRSNTFGSQADPRARRTSWYQGVVTHSPTVMDEEEDADAAPPYSPYPIMDNPPRQLTRSISGPGAVPELQPLQRTLTAPNRTRTMTLDQHDLHRGNSRHSRRWSRSHRQSLEAHNPYSNDDDAEAQHFGRA